MRTRIATNATQDNSGRELATTTTILEMSWAGDHLKIRFALKRSQVLLGPASDQMEQRRLMMGVRARRRLP